MTDRPTVQSPDTDERPAAPSEPEPSPGEAASFSRRLRQRTLATWISVVLAATFLVLWAVFAARAVDRNADPTPAVAPPDLRSTYDAAARLPVPAGSDRPYLIDDGARASPATPAGTPATPLASPVASPAGTSMAMPVGSPNATPVASPVPTS